MFISVLYMFRATMHPSSGELIVLIQHLVCVGILVLGLFCSRWQCFPFFDIVDCFNFLLCRYSWGLFHSASFIIPDGSIILVQFCFDVLILMF